MDRSVKCVGRRCGPMVMAMMVGCCSCVWGGLALAADPPVRFEDVSEILDFDHRGLEFGGGGLTGAVWFDYNNDGYLDLFLPNGKTQANALFENDGKGGFTNVAKKAKVENGLGNASVIAADFDNDGFKDLFLTGDGDGVNQAPVKLYHNLGNGTFEDITESSGVVSPKTAGAAAMADIDNDGFLDLFITGIGSLAQKVQHRNKLYRNNGDLTWEDISESSGVDTKLGACAAFFSDYNDDGLIDLFVADCNNVFFRPTPFELFRNEGDLTFTDVAGEAGIKAGGFWMGVGPADYDNDGDIDFFATNLGGFNNQPHALYRNNGNGTYTNVQSSARVGNFEFGWGCAATDFDNDGYADIFMAGSLPLPPFNMIGPGKGNPGRMLFNDRSGKFIDHTSDMPTNLSTRFTSGVAVGDYDNDGFTDIVVATEAWKETPGTPVLFHSLGNDSKWVKILLVGTKSNRDAVGARVRVLAGELAQFKEIYAGTSFMSMDSQTLTFGLDQNEATDLIEVRWPLGLVERFPNIDAATTVTLIEGEGQGVSCGRKAKLTAKCKKRGTLVKAKLKKADSKVDVSFQVDGGRPQNKTTNKKGKASAKWKNLEPGSHDAAVCDLSDSCG